MIDPPLWTTRNDLIHPLVVDPDGRLLAGGRRLEAVRKLGWTEVPVRIVDTREDALRALEIERDENTERKLPEAERVLAVEAVADTDSGATTIGGAYERVKAAAPTRTGKQRVGIGKYP